MWPSKIEFVPSYKYLGIWLDEHLNCAILLNLLEKLWVISYPNQGNFPFEAFSSLSESLVIPRMDNEGGGWGFKTFPKLQTIQNKAIMHVMDVGKNCPVDHALGRQLRLGTSPL